MKKVIIMVGTSIFENYLKEKDDKELSNYIKDLKNRKSDEYKKEQEIIAAIKNKINNWVDSNYEKSPVELFSEIKSIKKISEEIKEELEIYFLTSDTILSNLVFELIKENWEKFEEIKNFKFYPSEFSEAVIKGLQVQNRKEFSEGMVNLINRVFSIANDCWANVIINITAGYKATIPYLTILAQVNRCPIYYIFEETDALIKISSIPVNIDWKLFEKYWEEFERLNSENTLEKNEISSNFLKECYSLLEEVRINNHWCISLNTLGKILYKKYKSQFFIFYSTKEAYENIEKQRGIKEILVNKFWNFKIRESKTENKNGHIVYDDGNNPFRIFYFEDNGKIYIYQTFEDKEKYLRSLEKPFSKYLKDQFIEKAKPYRIKKGGNNV